MPIKNKRSLEDGGKQARAAAAKAANQREAAIAKIMTKPRKSLERRGRSTNYVTTGGAGYVPDLATNNAVEGIRTVIKDIPNKIKYRLYNNLSPIDYADLSRVPKAILGKADRYNNMYKKMPVLDEIYATYLGIPENKRHFNVRLEKSQYSPTKGAENVTYYRLPITDGIIGDVYDRYSYLANTTTKELVHDASFLPYSHNKQSLNTMLGYYTVGKGRDKKGDYVSYYDKWDINPFSGRLQNNTALPVELRKPLGKLNMDIGNPVHIYDRIYFDDYFDIPDKDRGGHYIPEVVVIGNRKSYKKGGQIYIAPSKRGTFTAAATKQGMRVQAFASKVLANKGDYSPAMVKKANFARNASKWH